MMLLAPLACALLAVSSVSAATLRGQVPPNHLLREYWLAGPSGRVVAYPANLTQSTTSDGLVDRHGSSHYEAFIKRDGSWSLELPDPAPRESEAELTKQVTKEDGSVETVSIPSQPETYLLKFRVRGLQFRQFRVDVRPPKREGQGAVLAVRAHNPVYPIASAVYLSNPEPLPLIEGPHTLSTFFHSVQDFNAVNYLWMTLKSPMILMALGAWALTSFMPKLTASLEPEEVAQAQQAQSQMLGRLQPGDLKGAAAAVAGGSNGASGVQARGGNQATKRK
ncbi:unnamed protein product [Parajaminaea phylloscopi]